MNINWQQVSHHCTPVTAAVATVATLQVICLQKTPRQYQISEKNIQDDTNVNANYDMMYAVEEHAA